MPNFNQGSKIIVPKKESPTDEWQRANNAWEYQMRKKEIEGLAANYFGDGSDGNTTISVDTELTSTEDGDMVVMNYCDLTVDVTKTLTVDNRCRGLLLFVDGDLTVNGTISMTARGCHANPADDGITGDTPVAPGDGNAVGANGIRIPFFTASDTDTLAAAEFEGCGSALYALIAEFPELSGNGKIIAFPKVGGAGYPGFETALTNGINGDSSSDSCGGGGTGGKTYGATAGKFTGGGGDGTCFSGGPGGGGCYDGSAVDAEEYGGAGGDGSDLTYDGGGGAGNPKGEKSNPSFPAEDGTGGLLIIICSGNITGTGSIESKGSDGGRYLSYGGGGGGSGGGAILVARVGTDATVTKSADGGDRGLGNLANTWGGYGGAGSIQTLQVTG